MKLILRNKKIWFLHTFLFLFIALFFIPVAVSDIVPSSSEYGVHLAMARANEHDGVVGNAISNIGIWIGTKILEVAASFIYVGGSLLDFAVNNLILGMGAIINSPGIGGAIKDAWSTIRDICNLVFIFGFVYIGIKTIIDSDSSSAKKFLAQLIISALLINFSLFITKAVIDVSNFTAFQIYRTINPNTTTPEGKEKMTGIGVAYATAMGISSYYKSPGAEAVAGVAKGDNFWFFILGSIMFAVAGFVFAAGGILICIRFVALVIIMVFSPLLFAGMVFSGTNKYANKVKDELIKHSIFAPAYLLFLLISLSLIQNMRGSFGATALDNSVSGSLLKGAAEGTFTSFGNFALIILFLIFSLKVASSLGVQGGSTVNAWGNSMRKGAQGYLGRGLLRANYKGYGIGAGLEKVSKSIDSGSRSNSKTARFFSGAARVVGVDSAAKGIQNAKFGSSRSYADVTKENKEIKRDREQNKRVAEVHSSITAGHAAGPTSQERINMERNIANASTEQLLKLLDNVKNEKEREALVANMTNSQFDSLMKTKPEELSTEKKEKLREDRAKAVKSRLVKQYGGTDLPSVIGKADGKDLDALQFNDVYANAGRLSSKQIDDMSSLTPTSKKMLKDNRNAQLQVEFDGVGQARLSGTNARAFFARITNDAERAKLPASILTVGTAAPYLNTNVLTKILDNDSITETDRATIKSNVTTAMAFWPKDKQDNMKKFFDRSPAGQRYG